MIPTCNTFTGLPKSSVQPSLRCFRLDAPTTKVHIKLCESTRLGKVWGVIGFLDQTHECLVPVTVGPLQCWKNLEEMEGAVLQAARLTAMMTCYHHALLPPCLLLRAFSQSRSRINFALDWVQEQGETNNPATAGCKSHKSKRL